MSTQATGRLPACFSLLALTAAVVSSALPLPAHGAVQGTAEPASTDSIGISITKASVAQISGLNDMSIARPDGDVSDITWSSDLCVYSSIATGAYSITATGSSQEDGAFVMLNGNNALPYEVSWSTNGADGLSTDGIKLLPGVPVSSLRGAATDNVDCRGSASGPTARLIINVAKTNLQVADAGTYTESLTLLIAAN